MGTSKKSSSHEANDDSGERSAYVSKGSSSHEANDDSGKRSAYVSVRFTDGNKAIISICTPKKKGIWPGILKILQENNFEVLSANFSTTKDNDLHCIYAEVPDGCDLESQDLQRMLHDMIFTELGT